MQTAIGAYAKSQSAASSNISFVKPEFTKGFKIDLIEDQEFGIRSKLLWPSKNQVIRIIPGYDSEGNIYPQNINVAEWSSDRNYTDFLSDTFFMATTTARFGDCSYPIITDYAPGSIDAETYGGETVLHNFIRAIIYACGDKGNRRKLQPTNEWKMWCGIGKDCRLSFDKSTLLMQALVFQANGQNVKDKDRKDRVDPETGDINPLLMVVGIDNKTSINMLCQALVEPSNPGLDLDPATNNKYGSMAELNSNKLFLNTAVNPQDNHAYLKPSVQAAPRGWTPTPFPLTVEDVQSLWHPWSDLLYYMTAEEQLKLCASMFGADTVNYVIGTDPKFRDLYIPEEIAAVGLGRYENSAGGRVEIQTQEQPQVAKPAATVVPPSGFGKGLAGARSAAPVSQPAKKTTPKFSLRGGTTDPARFQEELARIRQKNQAAADVADDCGALLDGEEELYSGK